MFIKEKDYQILMFLNDFGVSRSAVLSELFFKDQKFKRDLCNKRLRRLHRNDFLLRNKCLLSGQNIYRLSPRGIRMVECQGGYNYGYLARMNWNRWVHDDLVQKVLISLYKEGFRRFASERQLRVNPHLKGEVVPDLGLVIDDGKFFAIEVEIERKTRKRILDKIKKVQASSAVQWMLYLTEKASVKKNVTEVYQQIEKPNFFLEVATLNEFYRYPKRIVDLLIKRSKSDQL